MKNEQKTTFALREIVSPMSPKEFIANHWLRNEWAYINGDIARLESHPFISKICALGVFAPMYTGRVSLIHRERASFDVQGGSEALKYFPEGYTIYFRDVENHFPEIKVITERLANELAVPHMTSEIFASSGVSGVGMHSDYHLNLNLLLSGEKEWVYAKHNALINQTSICLPAGKKQVDPKQLEYLDGPLDVDMPADATKMTQRAGDLMFVPRGWWHSTRSFGDCISINFIFKKPNWAQLFASALEKELLSDPKWRAYPHGVSLSGDPQESALKELSGLVDSYKKRLQAKSSDRVAADSIKRYFDKY